MKLIQCAAAYVAAGQMMQQEWDWKTAHALVTVHRRLKPHVEFYAEKEMELAKQYGKLDEQGNVDIQNGKFTFRDPKDAAAYEREKLELGAVETEEDWAPVHVPLPEKIKPAYVEALEGLIAFGE